MTLPFTIRNPGILDELVPFIVATPANLQQLDLSPFGVDVPTQHVIDPLRLGSEGFLDLLHRLDGLTFGPEGMPMPRWVFYDCAELPGAIFGLGRPAATLWPKARELFQVPQDYDGIVPLSMYIAIPMSMRGVWFGHNLASIAPVLRTAGFDAVDLRGLGSLTKGLALKCFGVQWFWGATQWLSTALFIHVKFGPLKLATAYTPAHLEQETLTYGFEVTDDKLRASMGDRAVRIERPAVDFWVDSHDTDGLRALQDRIEAGERFAIPEKPDHGEQIRVPIACLPPEGPGLGAGLNPRGLAPTEIAP
jgi:hypothetical protein